MSPSNTSSETTTAVRNLAPSHAEIVDWARDLWLRSGCPGGHDDQIWLEAERRLIAAQRTLLSVSDLSHTLARQRTRARMASRSLLRSLSRTRA